MTEQQTASPELQAFFDKLINLKNYLKQQSETRKYNIDGPTYEEIYNILDDIIKDDRTGDTHA